MRICFEFLGATTKKPRLVECQDVKAMFALCDEMRENGQKGFLVRAKTREEAIERRAKAPKVPDQYYIL